MNKKLKRILIIVFIICIIILIVDGIYYLYTKNNNQKVYFDGVNSFDFNENNYITVGSNNDNEKKFEKAKISKYNQKKEKIWEKVYNTGYNSAFFGVKIDDDSIIAVGSFESTKKEHENSTRSALFVKYDKDGNIEFEKDFQVLGNSKFTNVYVVDDGYIVIGQSIYENMTLGMDDSGGAFIIKYNKTGDKIWEKNYGGSKSGIFNDIVVYNDNIYVVGKNYSRVGIVCKYDLSGNLLNSSEYKYTDTLGFTGISVTDDNLFVVGAKKVTDDDDDYNTDALIVQYNLDCNFISENSYNEKDMDRYNKVIIDSNNNIITIGHSAINNKKESNNNLNIFRYNGIVGKYKTNLKEVSIVKYGDDNELDDYFTDIKEKDGNYIVSGYSSYNNDGYLSKFITYSDALKVIEVK